MVAPKIMQFSIRGSTLITVQSRSRKKVVWSPTPSPGWSTDLPRKSRPSEARCSCRRALWRRYCGPWNSASAVATLSRETAPAGGCEGELMTADPSFTCKDQIRLQHFAGLRVVPAGLGADDAVAQRVHELDHVGDKNLVLVHLNEGRFNLDQLEPVDHARGSVQYLDLVALGVDLQIGYVAWSK